MKRSACLFSITVILASTSVAEASGEVQKLVTDAANRHGVSAPLALKVVKTESSFKCDARGSAGELGPLQIKPATARLIGYKGAVDALQTCGAGLEWGMKHLAMAIRAGGVWKHNQGLWAKRKSANAAAYEQRVLSQKVAMLITSIHNRAARLSEFATQIAH